jgi:transcriptional regulator CtsR
MSGISNIIEIFLKELIEEANGVIEIQRNELASKFECAPSQINYVLNTRFTPYKGYYIESRRGGGGYIRIIKVNLQDDLNMKNIISETLSDGVTEMKAYEVIGVLLECEIITKRESEIIKASISDRALNCMQSEKKSIRASILRNVLLILVN